MTPADVHHVAAATRATTTNSVETACSRSGAANPQAAAKGHQSSVNPFAISRGAGQFVQAAGRRNSFCFFPGLTMH